MVIAVVILAIGLIAGKAVEGMVDAGLRASRSPVRHPQVLGMFARYAIIGLALFAILVQLNIAATLVQILFASIVLAHALAFALVAERKLQR